MLKMFPQTYAARNAPEDRARQDRSRKISALCRNLGAAIWRAILNIKY